MSPTTGLDILDHVITVGPDDILIFQADQVITGEQAQMVSEMITAKIGDRIPFLVTGSNWHITVVRKAGESTIIRKAAV